MDPLLIDRRLRLFAFAAAPERLRYLAILRAFDAARQRYELQLSADAVAAELRAKGETDVPDDLTLSLDQLHDWGVLARNQDGERVRSLAEYRKRRSVYQMTELGWVAWQAVEGVLSSDPGEAELRRLVFSSVLEDLRALAEANRQGDGDRVNVLLTRLDDTLSQLANRASRFYLAMSDLARIREATPEVFLEHKDRLLQHLSDFLSALQHHRPLLARAVADVEATGVDALVQRAAASDTGVFASPEQKLERWREHWSGIALWFVGSGEQPSRAEGLDARTTRAIRDLAALLRRVSDARRGGVSRAAQLELLARWFVALPDDDAGHALFSLTFGLRSARHLSIAEAEASEGAPSWWDAAPVPVDTTLRKRGQHGSPGRPAPLRDVRAAAAHARAEQARLRAETRQATQALGAAPLIERVLTDAELAVLLRLLDRALQTRRPAAGSVAVSDGVRLRLTPDAADTVVTTSKGRLTLRGLRLEIEGSR